VTPPGAVANSEKDQDEVMRPKRPGSAVGSDTRPIDLPSPCTATGYNRLKDLLAQLIGFLQGLQARDVAE
jgi:hypothetical protein